MGYNSGPYLCEGALRKNCENTTLRASALVTSAACSGEYIVETELKGAPNYGGPEDLRVTGLRWFVFLLLFFAGLSELGLGLQSAMAHAHFAVTKKGLGGLRDGPVPGKTTTRRRDRPTSCEKCPCTFVKLRLALRPVSSESTNPGFGVESRLEVDLLVCKQPLLRGAVAMGVYSPALADSSPAPKAMKGGVALNPKPGSETQALRPKAIKGGCSGTRDSKPFTLNTPLNPKPQPETLAEPFKIRRTPSYKASNARPKDIPRSP